MIQKPVIQQQGSSSQTRIKKPATVKKLAVKPLKIKKTQSHQPPPPVQSEYYISPQKPVTRLELVAKHNKTNSDYFQQRCIPLSGDKMDVILSVKSNISEMPGNDVLSNFSEFDNIANEDWNEIGSVVKIEGSPEIARTKLDCYTSRGGDGFNKISKLQQAQCLCQNNMCNTYCTRTNAKQQRRIIKRLFKQDKLQAKDLDTSTFDNNLFGSQGDKKYIINATWWRKWSDYVNFTSAPDLHESEHSAQTTVEDHLTFYDKPCLIENAPLLDFEQRLIPSLVEHFDFEVVSADVWKHLNSWYQSDFKICRRLVRDQLNQLKLDLYPEFGGHLHTHRINTKLFAVQHSSPSRFQIQSLERSSGSSGQLEVDELCEGKQSKIDLKRF